MVTSKKSLATSTTKPTSNATQKNVEFRAFKFRQRDHLAPEIVVFCAPVGQIREFAAVEGLTPTTNGSQREQKPAKVLAIKKFLDADPKNTIPTAIILAFVPGGAKFQTKNGGTLSISWGASHAATIVDGQHRLFGIASYDPKMEVAVVGLLEADSVERAFQFLVINNKSTKVPATHTKAILAKMKATGLAKRLKGARLSFDAEGIKDVDLVNSDPDSPFYNSIDWTTTPSAKRLVQATAIELSLTYMSGLQLAELEDRDTRRSVFLTVWKTIKSTWPKLWKKDSRLLSKVGIFCLTRFIIDRISQWSDNEVLDIDITDLEVIEHQTKTILNYMDQRFWLAPWAEKSSGGFDTNQGKDRVLAALTQLYRNGRKDLDWYTDIDIVDSAA